MKAVSEIYAPASGEVLEANAELQRHEEVLREKVRTATRQMRTLYDIGQQISSTLSLDRTLGVILEKRDRLEEAVDELKKSTALDPAYPEPWYALGRIYQRQGDAKNAGAALAKFQRLKQKQRRAELPRELSGDR